MKNTIKTLTLLLVGLVATSCSSDNNDDTDTRSVRFNTSGYRPGGFGFLDHK